MKKMVIIALSIICMATANANEEFLLKFKDNNQILLDMNEWTKLSDEGNYTFYLSKESNEINTGYYKVHSLVEFPDPNGVEYKNLNGPVKRIFSYGIMDCEQGIFFLLGDFYTDKDNVIVFSSQFEMGTRQVEVLTPNTARNKAYIKVCIVKHSV